MAVPSPLNKPIEEMTDEELLEELERLNSIPLPASPVQKATKKRSDVKTGSVKSKRSKWKDQLGI